MEQLANYNLTTVDEFQLSYRNRVSASDRPTVSNSKECFDIFRSHWSEEQIQCIEEFKVMLLNRNNKVLGIINISSGGVNATVVDPKIIFAAALKACASSIILCHNHPSGSLTPSVNDRALTTQLKNGGKLLDISVLDHIILTDSHYYSMADEGDL